MPAHSSEQTDRLLGAGGREAKRLNFLRKMVFVLDKPARRG